ncbi:hypothetical protein KRX51_08115 [Corynebacterium sp. TAE3-ERU12]|uniref:MaoC/PaaZ C-terminal domain-containing protein n=1 Tax=Corynebacterium sp. TAE3-ERU12 TaxID=2849491 RepID=UPI001C471061|nr:MaoC/PaaZ C-terminal domain-containing protein [Corynebacterium sp. TAE3-ERU12]MBV7295872.1 hypothetical protein [Corynebacterium sp. TAE3-ERU12]
MTKTLSAVPELAPLYAKAAVGMAKKRPNSTELRTPALAVNGAAVPRERDEQFRRLVGAPLSDNAFFGHVHSLIMPLQLELMAADDFPLPMMGLVHTDNTYRQLADVPVDSTVDLEVRVSGFREHRAGTEVLLDATVKAAGTDTVLVEERSVYLAKGRRLKDVLPAEGGQREKFRVPTPTAQWRLSGDTGRKWAAISGDWNPIHITGLTAKALGMPAAIAHGMYTASRALAEADVTGPFEFTISFAAPVVLPATVQLAITDCAEGREIVAWHGKKKRPHFTGAVHRID